MSSFVKKTITCVCCGEKYEISMMKGYSAVENSCIDLDTNPHSPALYERVILCPNCGYATAEPYTLIPDDIKVLVKDDNYQNILKSKQYDDTCRKLLLAGYLSVKNRNAKEAGYHYLLAFWYMKEHGFAEFEKAREKAIKNFERFLKETPDYEVAMILVDLLRQSERFDEAMETLISLKQYIANNNVLKNVSLYEEKLIKSKDSKSHRLEEVTE